jgi:hypothetical protein
LRRAFFLFWCRSKKYLPKFDTNLCPLRNRPQFIATATTFVYHCVVLQPTIMQTSPRPSLTTVPADVIRALSDYLPVRRYHRLRLTGRAMWEVLNSRTMFARFRFDSKELFAIDPAFALDYIRADNDDDWEWQFKEEATDPKQRDLPPGHHRHRNVRYWFLRAAETKNDSMLQHCFEVFRNLRSLGPELDGPESLCHPISILVLGGLERLAAGGCRRLADRCMDHLVETYQAMDIDSHAAGNGAVIDLWKTLTGSMAHEQDLQGESRSIGFAHAAIAAHQAGHRDLAIHITRSGIFSFYEWTGRHLRTFLLTMSLTNDAIVIMETLRSVPRSVLADVYLEEGFRWGEGEEEIVGPVDGDETGEDGVVGLIGIELLVRDDPRLASYLVPTFSSNEDFGPMEIRAAIAYSLAANALSRGFVRTARSATNVILEKGYRHPLTVGGTTSFMCDPMYGALQYLSAADAATNRAEIRVRVFSLCDAPR